MSNSKIENILNELENLDTTKASEISELSKKKVLDNNPKLVIKPNNKYEIEYIKNHIIKEPDSLTPTSKIEVLLQVDSNLIGIGFTNFCYEIVVSILSYNPNIKVGVLIGNNINPLTFERLLLLPSNI